MPVPIPHDVFDMIGASDDLVGSSVSFILQAQRWSGLSLPYQLNWQSVKFDPQNTQLIPNVQQGIYSFVLRPGVANHEALGYLLYIGMTDKQSLRARYRQYLSEPKRSKPRPHIMRMFVKWPDHLYFCYSMLPVGADPVQLEASLLSVFMPPANRTFPASVRDIVRARL